MFSAHSWCLSYKFTYEHNHIHHWQCLMCVYTPELCYTIERGLWHYTAVSTLRVGWVSLWATVCEGGKGRERQRKERVRQAPTLAPAPYMHPIHSYLVPVTRWLQNGIDYWFPPYHRSVVLAGYSELSESLAWDNKRRGRNTRRKYTHFKTHSTYTLLLTEPL